jgi:hypothetical protein
MMAAVRKRVSSSTTASDEKEIQNLELIMPLAPSHEPVMTSVSVDTPFPASGAVGARPAYAIATAVPIDAAAPPLLAPPVILGAPYYVGSDSGSGKGGGGGGGGELRPCKLDNAVWIMPASPVAPAAAPASAPLMGAAGGAASSSSSSNRRSVDPSNAEYLAMEVRRAAGKTRSSRLCVAFAAQNAQPPAARCSAPRALTSGATTR